MKSYVMVSKLIYVICKSSNWLNMYGSLQFIIVVDAIFILITLSIILYCVYIIIIICLIGMIVPLKQNVSDDQVTDVL